MPALGGRRMEQGARLMQRRAVDDGELAGGDADLLPAWEREGREPAGMEDGHPDPTTAEGHAYTARRSKSSARYLTEVLSRTRRRDANRRPECRLTSRSTRRCR